MTHYAEMGWQGYLAEHRGRYREELVEFLRIPSISALPEHTADVRRAAEWLEKRLEAAGIEGARVLETGGHPVVYGEWLHAPGKPTLLLYAHHDVQPPGREEKWNTPPFEPVTKNGRLFSRSCAKQV